MFFKYWTHRVIFPQSSPQLLKNTSHQSRATYNVVRLTKAKICEPKFRIPSQEVSLDLIPVLQYY